MKFYHFLLIFSSLFIKFSYSQTKEFESSKLVKEDVELEDYINEKYNESKIGYWNDCNSKEKQLLVEILKERKKNTIALIKSGNLILSGTLYDFVNGVYENVRKTNPDLKDKKIILLKDESDNAFTMGEDILYIHVGLLYRLQSEDQLAFIICHELAHDNLNHYQQDLKDYITEKTDKDLEKKIKQIMSQEYKHASSLNELLVPLLLTSRSKSRTQEFDADSLGLMFYKNTNYNLDRACTTFDVFLESDHVRDSIEIDFKNIFKLKQDNSIDSDLSEYSNHSSLGSFDEETDIDDEIIKKEHDDLMALLSTHPYEVDRSIKLYKILNIDIPKNFNHDIDEKYKSIRLASEYEMVNLSIFHQEIGKALYYSLNLERNSPNDNYSKLLTSTSLFLLYYYKLKHREGIVLEEQDVTNDLAYDKMLYFFKKLSPENCYKLANKTFSEYNLNNVYFEEKINTLFIYYKENKNDLFKEYYEINKDSLKNTIYESILASMSKEVNARL